MAEFNTKFLEILSNTNQKNIIGSDFWVIDTEKVYYQGVFYLKTFVAVLVGSPNLLNEIRFSFKYDDKTYDKKVFEFSKTDKYQDLDVVGCVLPLPEEYSGGNYNLSILSVIYNQNLYDYGDLTADVYRPTTQPTFEGKLLYIKKYLTTFKLFPNVTENYWQCLCGKPNGLDLASCSCCQTDRGYVTKMFDSGIDELFWGFYSSVQPFEVDAKISFDENVQRYSMLLKPYNIDENFWKSKYDLEALKSEHAVEFEKYQKQLAKNERLLNQKQKKRKKITILGIAALAIVLFMSFVGFDLLKYGYAQWQFSSKNYAEAVTTFTELEDFLDAPVMVLESSYQLALTFCETDQRKCVTELEDLLETDHPGVQESFNEQAYDYAMQLMTKKSYDDAITYFEKVKNYRDSKTRINASYYLDAKANYAKGTAFFNSAFDKMDIAADANYLDARAVLNGWIYDYAKSLAASKNYYQAMTTIEKISDYLDSETLKKEYRYIYGKELLADKQYSLAVSTLTPISTYKDSATQIKEGNYRIALGRFSNGNYSTAYPLFKNLLGYRDSTAKYYACEDALYPWVLTGLAVSWWDDTYPAETDDSLWTVYDDFHLTAKLTGGVPGTTTDVKYVWCHSSCQSWVESGYSNGTIIQQTFYWTSPSYYTPDGWYTFSVYIKVRGVWKFLDSVSIYV